MFTESVILGEMGRDLIQEAGVPAQHRRELGGTQVLFHALEADQLDVYPEYTGTISGEILVGKKIRDEAALRAALAERGVGMSRPLGFNDSYAIGMREEEAARLGVSSLSDLRRYPDLKLGFSNEFMDRSDGWPGVRDRYGLPQPRRPGSRSRPGLPCPRQWRDPVRPTSIRPTPRSGSTISACSVTTSSSFPV